MAYNEQKVFIYMKHPICPALNGVQSILCDILFLCPTLCGFKYLLSSKVLLDHIGPESQLFAVKSTSAETGMGVTSRP